MTATAASNVVVGRFPRVDGTRPFYVPFAEGCVPFPPIYRIRRRTERDGLPCDFTLYRFSARGFEVADSAGQAGFDAAIHGHITIGIDCISHLSEIDEDRQMLVRRHPTAAEARAYWRALQDASYNADHDLEAFGEVPWHRAIGDVADTTETQWGVFTLYLRPTHPGRRARVTTYTFYQDSAFGEPGLGKPRWLNILPDGSHIAGPAILKRD